MLHGAASVLKESLSSGHFHALAGCLKGVLLLCCLAGVETNFVTKKILIVYKIQIQNTKFSEYKI